MDVVQLNETEPGENYRDTWVYKVAEEDWELRSSEGLDVRSTTDHALVYLPANRVIIVDAKCSLTAFVEAMRTGFAEALAAIVPSGRSSSNQWPRA